MSRHRRYLISDVFEEPRYSSRLAISQEQVSPSLDSARLRQNAERELRTKLPGDFPISIEMSYIPARVERDLAPYESPLRAIVGLRFRTPELLLLFRPRGNVPTFREPSVISESRNPRDLSFYALSVIRDSLRVQDASAAN